MSTIIEKAKVSFSPKLIKKAGKIGKVMRELMDKRQMEIQKELKRRFPKSRLPSNVVSIMLQPLVTLDGTRNCASLDELKQMVPEMTEQQLLFCLDYLEDSRIVIDNSGVYELAHDTLAYHINAQRTEGQKELIHRIKMVDDKFKLFPETKTYLNKRELLLLKEHLPDLEKRLTTDKWEFIIDSQQTERKRKLTVISLIIASILGLVIFSAYLYQGWTKEQKLKLDLDIEKTNVEKQKKLADNQKVFFEGTNHVREQSSQNRTGALDGVMELINTEDLGDDDILKHAIKIKNELLSKVERYPLYQSEKFYGKNDTPEKWEHFHEASDSTNAFFILNKKDNNIITYKLFKDGNELEKANLLFKHNAKVKDAIFSKDGKTIFAVDEENYLIQWNTETGESILKKKLRYPIHKIQLSLNKNILLLAGGNRKRKLFTFNLKNKRLTTIARDPKEIAQFKSSPTEELIVVLPEYSSTLRVYDYDGKHYDLNLFETPNSLAISPNGKQIAVSGLKNNTACIYNIKDVDRKYRLSNGHNRMITSISFSKDGKSIFTGGLDNKAVQWDTKGNIKKEFIGHDTPISKVWETKDQFVISADKDGHLRFWNQRSFEKKSYTFDHEIFALSACPKDENLFAVSLLDKKSAYQLVNLLDQPEEALSKNKFQHKRGKHKDRRTNLILEFATNGKSIYSGGSNYLTQEHDIEGGYKKEWRGSYYKDAVNDLESSENYFVIANDSRAVIHHKDSEIHTDLVIDSIGSVYEIAISANEDFFLLGGKKGFRLFRNENNFLQQIDKIPNNQLTSIRVDNVKQIVCDPKNNNLFATSGEDKQVNVWKIVNNKIVHLQTLSGHFREITDLAFSPTENKLLSSSKDGTVQLWDTTNEKFSKLPSLIFHQKGIEEAIFTADGQHIITGSSDKTVKVWPSDFEKAIHERKHRKESL